MGTVELHAEIDRLASAGLPLDTAVLGMDVVEIDRAIRRLQAEKSRRLGGFDLGSGCEAESHTTTKAWLQTRTRISPTDAAAQQAVARIHGELPGLFAAWHAGRTSYEHLRHVEINLRKLPPELWSEIDGELTAKAVSWPAKEFGAWLRELAQSLGPDPKPKDETQHEARRLTLTLGYNGMTNVHGSLTPEVAEKFLAALHSASCPDAPDEIRTKGQRNADALDRILDTALQAGQLPVQGGERPHLRIGFDLDQVSEEAQRAEEARRGGPSWYQLTAAEQAARVRAAVEAANAATDARSGRPQYYWTGPASSGAARRLACDGVVLPIFTRNGTPIDVGRSYRMISNPMRALIEGRDQHCQWPHCTKPAKFCQIHHVKHWKDGGTTDRWNLVLLCDHHHRAAHNGRWTVILHAPGSISVRHRTRPEQPYYEIRLESPPPPTPTLDDKLHAAAARVRSDA